MATYKWSKGVSGDWDAAGNWLAGAAPNGPAADVVVDAAPASAEGYYTVKIAAGANETVNSLDLANSNIGLEVDGTLTFAPGSAGALGREFQSSPLLIDNGKIVNAGLMFTFIQTRGDVQFTGSNPIYIAWELQVLDGTATVDTSSIAQYDAATHTLFDGAFEALGSGRTINLGGKAGGFVMNIETLTGPKPTPTHSYWTQLVYDDPGSQINEWDGTRYVPVESTLKRIDNSAFVNVRNGRDYTTANTLTIGKDGVFEQAGGTLSTGGLSVLAGGLLMGGISPTEAGPSTGRVVVRGAVANNGQIVSEGPGMAFRGALSGTGQITFNRTTVLPGFDTPVPLAVAGTLEVGSVGAGQTVTMIGNDTLILDDPAGFAGTVAGFDGSDKIVVNSAAAVTGVSYAAGANGAGTLTLKSGATVLGTLAMAGSFDGKAFSIAAGSAANSYDLTVGDAPPGVPTPPVVVTPPVATAPPPVATAPETANFLITNVTTWASSSAAGDAYNGPVAGLLHQCITVSTDNLNIAATGPYAFIHSGSGDDALAVGWGGGNNVLDGSTGSNFLVGGAGQDTFFVDDRAAAADIWSTVVNFHSGDDATIFGVTPSDFALDWQDGQGATGLTGLTLHAVAPGKPVASITLVGYTKADLGGRLSVSFGNEQGTADPYMFIHGN